MHRNYGISLMISSKKENLNIINFLLDREAIVDAIHLEVSNTKLIIESNKGNLEIIKLLIEHKADFEAKDKNDNTDLLCKLLLTPTLIGCNTDELSSLLLTPATKIAECNTDELSSSLLTPTLIGCNTSLIIASA